MRITPGSVIHRPVVLPQAPRPVRLDVEGKLNRRSGIGDDYVRRREREGFPGRDLRLGRHGAAVRVLPGYRPAQLLAVVAEPGQYEHLAPPVRVLAPGPAHAYRSRPAGTAGAPFTIALAFFLEPSRLQ